MHPISAPGQTRILLDIFNRLATMERDRSWQQPELYPDADAHRLYADLTFEAFVHQAFGIGWYTTAKQILALPDGERLFLEHAGQIEMASQLVWHQVLAAVGPDAAQGIDRSVFKHRCAVAPLPSSRAHAKDDNP